jgi:twitching motility two-component system response regulator PilG
MISYYEDQTTLPANMFREVPPESQEIFYFEAETPDFHKNLLLKSAKTLCAFCRAENESQATACRSCRVVLTLSDLEMLLANTEADREILRQSVERMESEKDLRAFSADEFKTLAVGHINLKNLRQGFTYLRQALQMRPNDVILSSQVDALAIRLDEIEQQQNIHDSMPKGRTILIVDDSETVRNLVTGRLEKSGHNVLCAADGVDALEKIKENLPDLVLLDVTIPRMDGYQVCILIRSNPSTKDVPVVMISEKDGFLDKVRARMAGTTGYIIKPFGPEKLLKTIETYIG